MIGGGGAIVGIIGPEGSGKTCLMTSYCVRHVSAGGKLFAFPGYEVHDKAGKPVSQTILPEEWVTIPDTLNNVLIAITEADSFFDSLETQNATAKLFRNLAKQRRKRSMSIIYDVNDWSWFNNRLRRLTHILYRCWDLFWSYRGKASCPERGTSIVVTPYDVQGFYTGRPWSKGRPRKFNASKFWPFFNTTDTVDAYQAMVRLKIKRREINVVDGQVVPPDLEVGGINDDELQHLAEKYTQKDPRKEIVGQVVDGFRKAGVKVLPAEDLRSIIESKGVILHTRYLGVILKSFGAIYKPGVRGKPHLYEIRETC